MDQKHNDIFTKMMSLESDFSSLGEQKIPINKAAARINRRARERAKDSICLICKKPCSSFCNSHSIPEFILHHIAENGKVSQVLQGELPTLGNDTGVKKAGTFQNICRECDSSSFQDYENPDVFSRQPTDKMLSQIALKNSLHMISKRKHEIEFYDILEQQYENYITLPGSGKTTEELDLSEYINSMKYALKAISGKRTDRYHLCFYKTLDYVVPYATQSSICLISDIEDGLINNIYNLSDRYHMVPIHVAVFPLNTTSIIMLFVESEAKRYRKFIKQLHKLDDIDQLSAINYMIFSYTENVFFNPTIYSEVNTDPNFMEVCHRTANAQTYVMFIDPLQVAIDEFSFSKRHLIPNLLSPQYAINNNDKLNE